MHYPRTHRGDCEGNYSDEPPSMYSQLSTVAPFWKDFVALSSTTEFKETSKINKDKAEKMDARYRRACVGYARLREQIIERRIREGEHDPIVTCKDTWIHGRMNVEHEVDDPTALKILEDMDRLKQGLEEDELNDINDDVLLDRAIPLEYSGRVRGYGWGVTKKTIAHAPELSEIAKLKKQCNRLENDIHEIKSRGYQPTAPLSCGSSHMDNFDDDALMASDNDPDLSDEFLDSVLPEGPIKCYLYVENPRRFVGEGILHNRPNEILHGLPLPQGYARIQFEVAIEFERHSVVPQPTDEVRTVGEAVGHFISWPKRLVSLSIECPSTKKIDRRNDKVHISTNKPILKSVESNVYAKPLGYPKPGDSPHNSMVLHILRFLSPTIMTGGIEVPMTKYFDGEPWTECITQEHIVEILDDRWLSASSITFYIRYLGEAFLSENAELTKKISFVSPHITPMLGSGILSIMWLNVC